MSKEVFFWVFFFFFFFLSLNRLDGLKIHIALGRSHPFILLCLPCPHALGSLDIFPISLELKVCGGEIGKKQVKVQDTCSE